MPTDKSNTKKKQRYSVQVLCMFNIIYIYICYSTLTELGEHLWAYKRDCTTLPLVSLIKMTSVDSNIIFSAILGVGGLASAAAGKKHTSSKPPSRTSHALRTSGAYSVLAALGMLSLRGLQQTAKRTTPQSHRLNLAIRLLASGATAFSCSMFGLCLGRQSPMRSISPLLHSVGAALMMTGWLTAATAAALIQSIRSALATFPRRTACHRRAALRRGSFLLLTCPRYNFPSTINFQPNPNYVFLTIYIYIEEIQLMCLTHSINYSSFHKSSDTPLRVRAPHPPVALKCRGKICVSPLFKKVPLAVSGATSAAVGLRHGCMARLCMPLLSDGTVLLTVLTSLSPMPFDTELAVAGILGGTGIGLAACGAHILKRKLSPEKSHAFRTGGKYSTLAAIGMVALKALRETVKGSAVREQRLNLAIRLLAAGAAFFSWSIFWLCLGGPRFLGSLTPYLTPFGGSLMVSGWLTAATAAALIQPIRSALATFPRRTACHPRAALRRGSFLLLTCPRYNFPSTINFQPNPNYVFLTIYIYIEEIQLMCLTHSINYSFFGHSFACAGTPPTRRTEMQRKICVSLSLRKFPSPFLAPRPLPWACVTAAWRGCACLCSLTGRWCPHRRPLLPVLPLVFNILIFFFVGLFVLYNLYFAFVLLTVLTSLSPMPFDTELAVAGILGGTGIGLAACGAHILKRKLSPEKSHAFRTGGKYSTLAAIGMVALKALRETVKGSAVREQRLNLAIRLLAAGAAFFSWSIFWLCLGGPRFLGSLTPYLTPFGGSLMVSGWLTAATAAALIQSIRSALATFPRRTACHRRAALRRGSFLLLTCPRYNFPSTINFQPNPNYVFLTIYRRDTSNVSDPFHQLQFTAFHKSSDTPLRVRAPHPPVALKCRGKICVSPLFKKVPLAVSGATSAAVGLRHGCMARLCMPLLSDGTVLLTVLTSLSPMPFDTELAVAGILGGTGIGLAACGAHILKRKLSPEKSHAFRTGGKYSTLAAIGMVALKALRETVKGSAVREQRLNLAIRLLAAGAAFFSWSIFWLCLGGPRFLGSLTPYLTPFGGSLMVSGWLTAATAAALREDPVHPIRPSHLPSTHRLPSAGSVAARLFLTINLPTIQLPFNYQLPT
eukprot:gene8269-5788_t